MSLAIGRMLEIGVDEEEKTKAYHASCITCFWYTTSDNSTIYEPSDAEQHVLDTGHSVIVGHRESDIMRYRPFTKEEKEMRKKYNAEDKSIKARTTDLDRSGSNTAREFGSDEKET